MPKLKIREKKRRDRRKLQAIMKNDTLGDAAKEVYNIGSQGAKDTDASARSLGSQMLKSIDSTMLEEALNEGITPAKIAKGLKAMVEGRAVKGADGRLTFDQKKFGIETLLKLGIGGGYAPTKSEHTEKKVEAYLIGVLLDGPKSTSTEELKPATS